MSSAEFPTSSSADSAGASASGASASVASVSSASTSGVSTGSASKAASPAALPAIRIGQGYDVHALVPGRRLVLGGIEVPHHSGLMGHSDADALLHAITDALLGALAWGDIGTQFPDTDTAFKNADSRALLAEVVSRVHAAGWQVINVDSTVIAQSPRLGPHIAAMRACVASLLAVTPQQVGIKAKTNEKLGYLGRNEAIEAQAVVLLGAR
jgi:2-C-methyl-D-erythritol 2,4-cyclodiphosphate synthase